MHSTSIRQNLLLFFDRPTILAFFPTVIILIISFVITWPVYQVHDDGWIMRGLADGTLVPPLGKGPFLLFSSVIYGYILNFFYTHFPGGYWYDVFFYLFLSASVYIISYALLTRCNIINKKRYNVAVILTIPAMFVFPFIRINFTLVCGALSIGAVLLLFDTLIAKQRCLAVCARLFCVFFAIIFAFIIRWEACLACSFFTAISTVFLLTREKWLNKIKRKKIYFYSVFIIVLALGCMTLRCCDIYLVKNNDMWNFLSEFNKLRATIHDQTMYENNLSNPILAFNTELSNISDVEKGYYALLLSWNYIGEQNFFNLKSIDNFSNRIKKYVNISRRIKVKFLLGDYMNVFPRIIIVFVAVILFLRLNFNFALLSYNIIIFIFTISGLNLFFRAIPDRLWYNFAIAFIVSFFMYIKAGNAFCFFKKSNIVVPQLLSKNIYITIITFLFFLYSLYQLMQPNLTANSRLLRSYEYYSTAFKHIDNENIYLLNLCASENLVVPFRPNIMAENRLKYIVLSPISDIYQYNPDVMRYYGLHSNDTWLNILQDTRFKYVFLSKTFYSDFYINSWINSLTIFLKAKYNIEFGISSEDHPLFSFISCKILSDEEQKTRKNIVDLLNFFIISTHISSESSSFKNILLENILQDYEKKHPLNSTSSIKTIISTLSSVMSAQLVINFSD